MSLPDTVVVGFDYEVKENPYTEFDVDLSAIVLGPDGSALAYEYFIFFNNPASSDGAIEHLGVTPAAGGVEQIRVCLSGLPDRATRVVFATTIYDADKRSQSFGHLRNLTLRVLAASGLELARHNLSPSELPDDDWTAAILGEFARDTAGWSFHPLIDGYASGLGGIARNYGIPV